MDNPIAVVKSNVTVSKVIGFAVLAIVVFAIVDAAGLTNWILQPITSLKAKFSRAAP